MNKVIIFGNSGSGKSTLAKQLAAEHDLAHLDLDTVAWADSQPPERLTIVESTKKIAQFLSQHNKWVIEGCYADLLEILLPNVQQVIYLNLSIDACIANAKNRPWEPHKYESKAAQDANLAMLIEWIAQYENREDSFSHSAHMSLFKSFNGEKYLYTTNEYDLSD